MKKNVALSLLFLRERQTGHINWLDKIEKGGAKIECADLVAGNTVGAT